MVQTKLYLGMSMRTFRAGPRRMPRLGPHFRGIFSPVGRGRGEYSHFGAEIREVSPAPRIPKPPGKYYNVLTFLNRLNTYFWFFGLFTWFNKIKRIKSVKYTNVLVTGEWRNSKDSR